MYPYFVLAKKTYKNQITIPKEALRGLEKVEYFDVYADGGKVVLQPVTILREGERLDRIRQKIKALGLKEGDIEGAIQWARSRVH